MKRLAWLANPFFAGSLAAALEPLGWQVSVAARNRHETFTWKQVVETFGFPPDVLVYGDISGPPVLLGLESYPCLTVFCCVDSHIHSWYPLYAQAFDLCLVSLRDHLPRFIGPRLDASRLLWSMPFAGDADRPVDMPKTLDMVFIGKDDPAVTPVRSVLLARLRERFPGFVSRLGAYRQIYPTAKLVLNVAEQGDMNFRLFEALGCGCCLVTPRIGHGFPELFEDGTDLFVYDPDDFDGLCTLVERLLADRPLRERVAAAGLAKVDAGHRAGHRARAFAAWLTAHDATALRGARRREARAIHAAVLKPLYLHWSLECQESPLARRYLEAARTPPG